MTIALWVLVVGLILHAAFIHWHICFILDLFNRHLCQESRRAEEADKRRKENVK